MLSVSRWVMLVVLSITMLLLHLLPSFSSILEYRYEQFWQQPWRLFSTHLVHLDSIHLFSNLLSFICTIIIFSPVFSSGRLSIAIILSAAGASLLPYLSTQTVSFIGFSAVTHGLLSFAALGVIHRQCADIRPAIGYLMLLGLMIKSYLEFTQFDLGAHWLGVHIAYLAHAGGISGGVLAFYLHRILARSSIFQQNHKKSAV